MKIVFVFPYNTWGGAFRSTYVLGNKLIERGHDVEILFPFVPLRNGQRIWTIKFARYFVWGILRSLIRFKKIPFKVNAKVRFVPTFTDTFMPNADVIVANHWNTVEYVADLNPDKGRKFLYIRDVEQWADYYDQELAAFRLPLKKIAVAKWIKEFLWDTQRIEIDHVVENGTEWERFTVKDKLQNKKPTILMCYATHPMKDMDTGIKVLRRIKQMHPDVRIQLFGFPSKPKLKFDFKYFHRPTGEDLKNLYGDSEIYFCPSIQEGYHNPPREAMSARCAIVATNVGCIPDLGKDGENMFVVSPHDEDGMVEAISALITDPKLRINFGQNALEAIKLSSWDDKVNKFLEAIQ